MPFPVGDEVKHRPFHSYTMKQAIQEGFILDVLKYYTPVESYYRLAKTIPGDPLFDVKKARKKLRRYVEGHAKAIRDKTEIMVDHFLEQVIGQHKMGGQARAMLVTGSVERAIQYFFAFRDYLAEVKSPYQAIVAFSGEPDFAGERVSESKLNGFPGNDIAARIQEDPYRFLICADKFQTGYDEPLLHTMYVDSYRAERQATLAIALPDADAEIEPVPTSGGGHQPEPELDRLSNIVRAFNDQFGGLFADPQRMGRRIADEIPRQVAADQAYQNAKAHSDRQNARIEHDRALKRVITARVY